MVVVSRLLTYVDIADQGDDGPDARRMSVSARHEAVLADGRRMVLLDDRGWNGLLRSGSEPSEEDRLHELPGIWASQTEETMKRTARDVVGPDEPLDGCTQADMEATHWDYLARILREQGVEVEPAELKALPHDIELGDRVLARIGRSRPGTPLGDQ